MDRNLQISDKIIQASKQASKQAYILKDVEDGLHARTIKVCDTLMHKSIGVSQTFCLQMSICN